MGAYNAAGWLLDRHVEEGRGDRWRSAATGRRSTLRRAAGRRVPGPARARALGVDAGRPRRSSSSTTSRRSRPGSSAPCGPASSPVPVSTMLTAGELAADRRRRRRRAPSSCRPSTSPHLADRSSPPRRTVEHAVVVGDRATTSSVAVRRWAEFDDRGPRSPSRRRRHDSPAFWLYSSGTTGVPKGVMHRHGSLQATADTYAARVLGVTPDDRFLSVAKLFFAYGLGNCLTFPLGGRGDGDPRAAPTDAAAHRRARRRRAADAVLRQPWLRRRPARHRRRRRRVRQRAGDRDRRRVAARRPAATLQRALRASRARRHRLDRGAAHLPVQHPRRPAAGHERHDRSPATRPVCSTTPAPRSCAPGHARLPPRARPVRRHGLLAAARGHRRGVPRRRLAAHRRRLHPLGRRCAGRSSGATTT